MNLADTLPTSYPELKNLLDATQTEINEYESTRAVLPGSMPEERLKIERDLKKSQEKLALIKRQMQKFPVEALFEALKKLDYDAQGRPVALFGNHSHSAGAFLIHGPIDHGQEWLLNRCLTRSAMNLHGKYISIRCKRRSRGTASEGLLREIGGKVCDSTNPTLQEVQQALCDCWQTQNIILCLKDVHVWDKETAEQFLTDIWRPLVATPPDSPYKLMLFLIYESDDGDLSWPQAYVEKCCVPDWQPNIVIRLPILRSFTAELLRDWMDNEYERLPETLWSQAEQAAREVFQASYEGMPLPVLQEICDRCHLNWYSDVEPLLKY